MENCKTFYEVQIASHLKEIIQPPLNPLIFFHQIKPYYVSGTSIFLQGYTEIWRHFLSKCFKNAVLGRREMVQCKCFFLTPNRNNFAGKFAKSERFLAVLREHIIFNVKWVKVQKISEVFWGNLYRKMSDLFL